VKIRSKRTVVLGAILGGLLAAGSVAAHATDLPVLGSAADNLKVDSLTSALPLAGAKADAHHDADKVTRITKADGIGSGNDVNAGVGPVSPNVPVNACGIAANVLVASTANASCRNHQTAKSEGRALSAEHHGDGRGRGDDAPSVIKTANGILSGNDILAGIGPVSPNIPVNICGIAANVLGANANGSCDNSQVAKSKGAALSR